MKAATSDPSPDLVADAHVARDVIQFEQEAWRHTKDRKTSPAAYREPEIRELVDRVRNGAIAQYLRRFPRARAKGIYVQAFNGSDWDVVCLFCRADLNTFGKGGRPPLAFWIPIEQHCELCAALFLSGYLVPIGPGGAKGMQQLPVSSLRGNKLIAAAKEAAAYLSEATGVAVAEPCARADRRGGGGVAGVGRARELRAIVSEARRVQRERAKETG